jgi:hypothetical protein
MENFEPNLPSNSIEEGKTIAIISYLTLVGLIIAFGLVGVFGRVGICRDYVGNGFVECH